MPAKWLAQSKTKIAFQKKLDKIPSKYHENAWHYWRIRAKYKTTDTSKIKLKVMQQGPVSNGGSGGNGSNTNINNNQNPGGNTSNDFVGPPRPAPTKPLPEGYESECPDENAIITLIPQYKIIYDLILKYPEFDKELIKRKVNYNNLAGDIFKEYVMKAMDILYKVRTAAIVIDEYNAKSAISKFANTSTYIGQEFETVITEYSISMKNYIQNCNGNYEFVTFYNPYDVPYAYAHTEGDFYKAVTNPIYIWTVAICLFVEEMEPIVSFLLSIKNARQQALVSKEDYYKSVKGKHVTLEDKRKLYNNYKANWDGRMDEYTYD